MEDNRASGGNAVPSQWLTQQNIDALQSYEMGVAPGLHLSAAVARMETSSRGLGVFEFKGAGLSCMRLDDHHQFQTRLSTGDTRTFGMHVPLMGDGSNDDAAEQILRQLRMGASVRSTYKAPAALICRLCAPLDPWFSGAARDLAMEARTLELKATVLAWLQDEHQHRDHRHHAYAYKARDIIHDDPGAPITIAFLAREVGLNARSLTEAFRAVHGMSIATCLVNARLELALDMLATGASVSQTAHKVGYAPAYFSMAFRRRFGLSPSQVSPPPDSE